MSQDSETSPHTWPTVVAAGAVAATGITGILPGFVQIPNYSPTVSVTVITAWAIIGYTYLTYRSLQYTKARDEARRTRETAKARRELETVLDAVIDQCERIIRRREHSEYAPYTQASVIELRRLKDDADRLFALVIEIDGPVKEVYQALRFFRWAYSEQSTMETPAEEPHTEHRMSSFAESWLYNGYAWLFRARNPEEKPGLLHPLERVAQEAESQDNRG